MPYERIYLVGMPGCGKSTEAKKLAKKLQWECVDLDVLIEKLTGLSVPEIFQQFGETYFRKKEREALEQTFGSKQLVIACGGGTPAFENNMELINQQGLSIYLSASSKFLLKRILAAKVQRPMFWGLESEEIYKKIETILTNRMPFYQEAKLSIQVPKTNSNELFICTLSALKLDKNIYE